MCFHVTLTLRSNDERVSYPVMDCDVVGPTGQRGCVVSDQQLAHLMASGQFSRIEVFDEERGVMRDDRTKAQADAEWADYYAGRRADEPEEWAQRRTYDAADFPAFVAAHLPELTGALPVS